MNTIQNYGSVNVNANYGIKSPNFKSKKNIIVPAQNLKKEIPDKFQKVRDNFKEKFCSMLEKMCRPTVVKVEPAKDYKELQSILKSNIRACKVFDFIGKIVDMPLKLLPKKMRPKEYNAGEIMNMGYEFALNNKNKLDILTYEVVRSSNVDYLKGILKAIEELGLVK